MHIFFQLKGGYRLGWFSAVWRTLLLLVFSIMAMGLFLGLIVLLGLTS
jgi:hypothetical protein